MQATSWASELVVRSLAVAALNVRHRMLENGFDSSLPHGRGSVRLPVNA